MANPRFWWYLPGKMGMFHGYVSLPEGKSALIFSSSKQGFYQFRSLDDKQLCQHIWESYMALLAMVLPSWDYCHYSRQIITTKPPVGHPKMWWKGRESPAKCPDHSGLGIGGFLFQDAQNFAQVHQQNITRLWYWGSNLELLGGSSQLVSG